MIVNLPSNAVSLQMQSRMHGIVVYQQDRYLSEIHYDYRYPNWDLYGASLLYIARSIKMI